MLTQCLETGLFHCKDGCLVLGHSRKLNSLDDPRHEVRVIPGLLVKILRDFDIMLPLLDRQEITNGQVPVATKASETQVLMIVKLCNINYLLKKVNACACNMYITVQCPIHSQQELFHHK